MVNPIEKFRNKPTKRTKKHKETLKKKQEITIPNKINYMNISYFY